MATNLNVIIHGPDIQFDNGNHGSKPKMSVNIDIGNFTRNINSSNPSNTTATCVISSISMNQLGSPVNDGSYASSRSFFFTHLLEVGARLCSHSDTSTTPSKILFVKQRSWANLLCPESVWFGKSDISSNHTVWGKGTYNGINFKTTTGYSENPVNFGTKTDNPGSTTMTATVPVTESTIELRLYIRSGCDCHQVSGGLSANDWVKVVAVDMTSYFRLPTPTLAIKQSSRNIEVISAQETVNLVTTSGDTPDSYVFEYAWKNPTTNTLTAYKTLSTSSTSTVNFTHNADRERTDFSIQWPINLYFRVKTVKAGYTDSDYSNVVHLQTLYNPIELQSGPTINYYDQNNNLVNDYSSGFVNLSGKFKVSATGKVLSAHKGNCVSYDVKLCDRSGTELSTVVTNVPMPASNDVYSLSDINNSYPGGMSQVTPYKLKFLFHYQDTSVPSSSSYYNKYPSTSYDHPLEYFSNEFKLGQAPNVPSLIYPSGLTDKVTYSREPKLIFKVNNPSGMELSFPEITSVSITYNDGYVDVCTINESGNSLSIINSPGNKGSFLSIRKGKTSSLGYTIVYKIRPFTGSWYTTISSGSLDMVNMKIQSTNFMGIVSDYRIVSHFYRNSIDLVVSGTKITANSAVTLGNSCRDTVDAYSKLINDYQDESSSTNRVYNSGSSTTYSQSNFKDNLIYRDKVTYNNGDSSTTISVISLWLKWLSLPKSSAISGKYGILEKLESYGGVTETKSFSYSQALTRSSSGNIINAKNRGDNDYYFGNIYNLIVDLLLNYL